MLSNPKNMTYSTLQKNLRTSLRFAFYELREQSSHAVAKCFFHRPYWCSKFLQYKV